MTKSILESLTVKSKTGGLNKSEVEEMEEYILDSINIRISDMRAFVDIFVKCEMEYRDQIASTVLWHVFSKLDEIEDLNKMFGQLNSGKPAENIRNGLNHLNHVNMYNYDDAIEEISLAILA